MNNWTKLPAIQGRQQPCLHAGVAKDLFPAEGVIAVGFGSAYLTCDGSLVWSESYTENDEKYMTGAEAEELAKKDPDHDWRIGLFGALSEREYQRHGDDRWVLVHQGRGFA